MGEFASDIADGALAIAHSQGVDYVSQKHVDAAAHLLRTCGQTPSMWLREIGVLLLGAGLSALVGLLLDVHARSAVMAIAIGLIGVGGTSSVMFWLRD